MSSIGLQSRHLSRLGVPWPTMVLPRRSHSSQPTGSPPSGSLVQPLAPIFNRREKKKLRLAFPRPDRSAQILHPALPPSFVNLVTMADGSSFYLTTRSPRPTITLARDVSNHPLWNPSLAREVADQDQSGRMGRFARRYGRSNSESTVSEPSVLATQDAKSPADHPPSSAHQSQTALDQHGFGVDDLQWISGNSPHSFYGVGNAKNIKGLKKTGPAAKK